MRKYIIAGNWKMNKTFAEASELSKLITRDFAECTSIDIVLCPSYTAIKSVSDIVSETQIKMVRKTYLLKMMELLQEKYHIQCSRIYLLNTSF